MNSTTPTNVLPFLHAEDDAAAAAAAAEAAKKKVAFDDDQKARINEIFKERYGEVQEKHRKEIEDVTKKLTDDFEAKLAEAITAKAGKKEGSDDAENAEFKRILEDHKKATEAERAARVKLENDLKQRDADMLALRKEQAIRTACQGLSFVKLDHVLALTGSNVEWDKGSSRFIVRNDEGDIVQGDDLKPISLGDYYTKWAEENPHFVKSDARGGAGSTSANGSTAAAGEFSAIKTKADLKDNMQLRIKYIEKYGLKKYEELPLK